MDTEKIIEKQFRKYLAMVELDITKMPGNQVNEMRKCFFGAWGQFLILMQQDMGQLPDALAADIMDRMHKECAEFWKLKISIGG